MGHALDPRLVEGDPCIDADSCIDADLAMTKEGNTHRTPPVVNLRCP